MIHPNVAQSNRAHDLYQVKMAIQAHNKRSQEGYASIKAAQTQPQQVIEPKTISGPGKRSKSNYKIEFAKITSRHLYFVFDFDSQSN